jgi:hypothetical protein
MTDWAAWGTSVGTLVLAGATFAAVRSSNRTAKVAERTLQVGLRPVLAPARAQDPGDQVQFADGRVFDVGGGRALAREQEGVIYLAIPLRNVGPGIAVLRAYRLEADAAASVSADPLGPARHRRGDLAPDPSSFSEQQRDLYVPPGDIGFWQAARRDPAAPEYRRLSDAIESGGRVTVDVLYSDHEGGQRTITRFVLLPSENGRWRCDVTRHWTLDALV